MSGFWLWFWRPIGEMLGSLALIAFVIIAFVAVGVALVLLDDFRRRFCGKTKQPS